MGYPAPVYPIDFFWPLAWTLFGAVLIAQRPALRWRPDGVLAGVMTALLLLPGLVYLAICWHTGAITEDEVSSLRHPDTGTLAFLIGDRGMPSRLHRILALTANQTVGMGLIRAVHAALFVVGGLILGRTTWRLGGVAGLAAAGVVLWDPTWLIYSWESRAYPFFFLCNVVAACAIGLGTVQRRATGPMAVAFVATGLAMLDNPLCIIAGVALVLASVPARRFPHRRRMAFAVAAACFCVAMLPTLLPALSDHSARATDGFWPTLAQLVRNPDSPLNRTAWVLAVLALVPGPRGHLARVATLGTLGLCVAMLSGVLPVEPKISAFWLPWQAVALASWMPRSRAVGAVLVASLLQNSGAARPPIIEVRAPLDAASEAQNILAQVGPGIQVYPEFTRTRLVSSQVDTRWMRWATYWDEVAPALQRQETWLTDCPQQGNVIIDARYEICGQCDTLIPGKHWALLDCGPPP